MWGGLRTLVVVPARGGSKGVPLKNLRPLAGVPLVAWVGHLVRALDWVDRAVVSTDHAEIARTARESGLDAPFYRPPELSGDRVGDLDVLAHALDAVEALDRQRYDVVVMLQPTSPLRRPEHVTATVEKLASGAFDSVWTISPTDSKSHPWKQLRFEEERLSLWDPKGAGIVARQQLPPVYQRNGAAYAFTRACLLEQRTVLGARASALVLDEPMVSIDTTADFEAVETILRERDAGRARSEPAPPERPPRLAPRTFVIDLDGVIAALVPHNDYARSAPLPDNIARVNALHERGHRIVLYTARGSASGRDWTETTRRQLERWGVKYHELRFGKPAADYYIDDRLISLEDAVELADAGPHPDGSPKG